MKTPEMTVRPGVSLVEVLVAITLMAVVLSGLGGLAFTAARQNTAVAADNYRQGVLTQEVNRLSAWPFDDLPGEVGCTTTAGGSFPHQRCVAVTTVNSTRRQVRIIITPSVPGALPDSVTLERTRPPVGNVLSTS